ncbi:MAG: pimeloyl-ACP methyl esterase BioG family protein [Pseudoruegeria sp.]
MTWLHKTSADHVIVVFGGWGIGPEATAHLNNDVDVLWVSDYRDLSTGLPDVSGYKTRSLLAWSFGVAGYLHWRNKHTVDFDRRVALCGSPCPVDRRAGIPPRVFSATRDGLTPKSFLDFLSLCYGEASFTNPDSTNIDVLRSELTAVADRGNAETICWDKVILAVEDRIFPVANLRRAFDGQSNIQDINAPHVPFAHWNSWKDILS